MASPPQICLFLTWHMHQAMGNVFNEDFHAVCQSFCYSINNKKYYRQKYNDTCSVPLLSVSVVEQD